MPYKIIGQQRNVWSKYPAKDLEAAKYEAKQEANQSGHRVYVYKTDCADGKKRKVATIHPDPEFQDEQYYGPRTKHSYRGFDIMPKRDFGFQPYLSKGKMTMTGFVVGRPMINVMPGATWFGTVEEAKQGIDIFIECGGSPEEADAKCDAKKFWAIMSERYKPTSAVADSAPSPTSTSP